MINPIPPKKLSTWDRIPTPVKSTSVALFLSFQEILFFFSRINKEMHASQNTMMNRRVPKGCDFATLVNEINTYKFNGPGMMFLIRAIGSEIALNYEGRYDFRGLVCQIIGRNAPASLEIMLASNIDLNFSYPKGNSRGNIRVVTMVAARGYASLMQRLVDKKADITLSNHYISKISKKGPAINALGIALARRHYDVVKVLINAKADVNACASRDDGSDHSLALADTLDMVLLLDKHGAEWNQARLDYIKDNNEPLYKQIVAHPELKERLQKLGLLDQLAEDSL